MNSLVTNDQIKTKVQERWPDLEISRNTIRDAQVNLGFKFRPPMIIQDVLPEQRFQRHQFGLDMVAKNCNPEQSSFLMNADVFSEATSDVGIFNVVSGMRFLSR
jgi:hypothetical protein